MGVQMKCSPPPLPSPAEEGTFSCQVPSFSPLVLLADHHWNMPYRSWQLSPSGPDSTLLTVNGAHLQVKVEIKVGTADLLSPHPLPHHQNGRRVCVCVCVCACVISNKVDTLSSYPTPLGSVCHVRLVPTSMSCTVCLCRRSQLVTRPGLSPVLPAPAVSAHLWCQRLPLQRQPQICGLT